MTAILAALVVFVLVVIWRRRKAVRERPKLWEGHPTGSHSPYVTPGGRLWRNSRTL